MHSLRCHLWIGFQDLCASLFLHILVCEIIAEGLSIYEPQLSASECNNYVIKALHEVYLNPSIYKSPCTFTSIPMYFSYELRQLIVLIRAIILSCIL